MFPEQVERRPDGCLPGGQRAARGYRLRGSDER
jgi:hypothetical protein